MVKPRIRVPSRSGVRIYDYIVMRDGDNPMLCMRSADFEGAHEEWDAALMFYKTGISPYPRPAA